ncbi:hypothetical protein CALCODRAFT_465174 [Calocera cornea HHB12733]|uniref:RING-type domain-containing protein n=1 Tax=Calocera cornea HHB12733 TaxID=1353952 RepID=A0A165II85_9BASI|nr:hypothetical protein CALCODRAFT_465174 [Calocera cornea HHB12733]
MMLSDESDAIGHLWRLWQDYSSSEGAINGQIFGVSEVFRCGICLEDEDYNIAIRLDCGHEFCSDSLIGTISSRVQEGMLPIPCPSCSASDPDTRNYISLDAAKTFDLPEEVIQRWERSEVEAFAVFITCRRCGQSGMIDRTDFLAEDQISCPFGECDNRWCRNCEHPVVYGQTHTCDGTFELAQTMEQNGWKMCPGGCGARIERSEGCDHITCIAPGCYAHFCYRCGALIIRSQDQNEVSEAVRVHYKTCAT